MSVSPRVVLSIIEEIVTHIIYNPASLHWTALTTAFQFSFNSSADIIIWFWPLELNIQFSPHIKLVHTSSLIAPSGVS